MVMIMVGVTGPARAFDVDAPAFGSDVGERIQVSFIVDHVDRDIELEPDTFITTGPAGTIPTDLPEADAEFEGTFFGLRASAPLGEKVVVFADASIADVEDSDDAAFLIGGGARLEAYRRGPFHLALFGAGRYIPELDFDSRTFDVVLGNVDISEENEFYEINGGVLAAYEWELDGEASLLPYVGGMVSIFRGDSDVTFDFEDVAVTSTGGGDIEEESLANVIVGLAFRFAEAAGFRVEGRFIDQTSVSGGVFFGF